MLEDVTVNAAPTDMEINVIAIDMNRESYYRYNRTVRQPMNSPSQPHWRLLRLTAEDQPLPCYQYHMLQSEQSYSIYRDNTNLIINWTDFQSNMHTHRPRVLTFDPSFSKVVVLSISFLLTVSYSFLFIASVIAVEHLSASIWWWHRIYQKHNCK